MHRFWAQVSWSAGVLDEVALCGGGLWLIVLVRLFFVFFYHWSIGIELRRSASLRPIVLDDGDEHCDRIGLYGFFHTPSRVSIFQAPRSTP